MSRVSAKVSGEKEQKSELCDGKNRTRRSKIWRSSDDGPREKTARGGGGCERYRKWFKRVRECAPYHHIISYKHINVYGESMDVRIEHAHVRLCKAEELVCVSAERACGPAMTLSTPPLLPRLRLLLSTSPILFRSSFSFHFLASSARGAAPTHQARTRPSPTWCCCRLFFLPPPRISFFLYFYSPLPPRWNAIGFSRHFLFFPIMQNRFIFVVRQFRSFFFYLFKHLEIKTLHHNLRNRFCTEFRHIGSAYKNKTGFSRLTFDSKFNFHAWLESYVLDILVSFRMAKVFVIQKKITRDRNLGEKKIGPGEPLPWEYVNPPQTRHQMSW